MLSNKHNQEPSKVVCAFLRGLSRVIGGVGVQEFRAQGVHAGV